MVAAASAVFPCKQLGGICGTDLRVAAHPSDRSPERCSRSNSLVASLPVSDRTVSMHCGMLLYRCVGFPIAAPGMQQSKQRPYRMYNLRRGPGPHLCPACTRRDCTSRICDLDCTDLRWGLTTSHAAPSAAIHSRGRRRHFWVLPGCSRVALVTSGAVAHRRLHCRRRWRAGDRDPDKATTGAPKPLPFPL